MTLTIAFPSRGICDPGFAVALRLLKISKPFRQLEVLYIEGTFASYARDRLVDRARGDYILFLDDDTLPPPDAIGKLYSHKKDIISGLYYARQEPHFPQIFRKNERDKNRYDAVFDVPENQLIEVDACGGGCLLVNKKVFEEIELPYFEYILPTNDRPRKGGDLRFCEKARGAGFKIFCDTSVVCRHLGKSNIGPEYWEISKKRLEEIKEKMGPEKFEEFKKRYWY